MAAGAGFEPTTLWLTDIDSTKAPPRPHRNAPMELLKHRMFLFGPYFTYCSTVRLIFWRYDVLLLFMNVTLNSIRSLLDCSVCSLWCCRWHLLRCVDCVSGAGWGQFQAVGESGQPVGKTSASTSWRVPVAEGIVRGTDGKMWGSDETMDAAAEVGILCCCCIL